MYGVITTVTAPVEMYDGIHAEMKRRAGTSVDGLFVHVGRATTDGFEVLEVWESQKQYDRANDHDCGENSGPPHATPTRRLKPWASCCVDFRCTHTA